MGEAAAIVAAAIWAVSATMMASQTARVDSLSISAIRASWAALFFVIVLFPLGADGDLAGMSADDMAELIISALIGLALGDTLYVASIAVLGMNRAYTISIGLFTLFSFALSVIFLDEPVGWNTVAGAVLVLGGVYVVALYGRARRRPGEAAVAQPTPAASPAVDGGPSLPVGVQIVQAAGDGGAPVPLPGERDLPGARLPILGALAPRTGTGLILVAVAALCWGIATVWLRAAAEGYDATAVGTLRIPTAALLLSAAAVAQPGTSVRRWNVSRRSQVTLAVAGVLGTGLGSLLFIYAVQEAGAGQTAVLSSISPIFALPLGALVLRERLTPWLGVGTVLAVGGIILLS